MVALEVGVRLSPFSSSNGFLGCSSCRPPLKKLITANVILGFPGERGRIFRNSLCLRISMILAHAKGRNSDTQDCPFNVSLWRNNNCVKPTYLDILPDIETLHHLPCLYTVVGILKHRSGILSCDLHQQFTTTGGRRLELVHVIHLAMYHDPQSTIFVVVF